MKSFRVDLASLLTVAAAVLNQDGVLLKANAGFLRLLPADVPEPVGSKVGRFFVQPTFASLTATLDRDGRSGYRGLLTIGDYDGKARTLRGRVWRTATGIRVLAEYDIADLERVNDAMLGLGQEQSLAQHALTRAHIVLKRREGQLVKASLTDALTGIGNRRKLDDALASEISRAQRSHAPLSVFMTDIDHFKRVNDEYGHSTGDRVLVLLGAILKSQSRSTDIAARFGGEEFMVLMPGTPLALASSIAERIRRMLEAEVIEPIAGPVTSSFGVAELAFGETGESLLKRVDAALYRAKHEGRNRVIPA
jgi:two-component system cell cycle response regulator